MKRLLDFFVAGSALIVLSPVLVLVAGAILLTMGRPILFRQPRGGRGGKPFQILKFRTMNAARDGSGALLPDAQRLTVLGRFIRATSLDELPQAWNVLTGDMSLVGPRPLLAAYVPRYNPRQRRRLEVRPGMTGWAQIHGRNALSWEEKFEHDVWYVEHHTFLLDLRILVATLINVFRRKGISAQGHATMPEFRGSR